MNRWNLFLVALLCSMVTLGFSKSFASEEFFVRVSEEGLQQKAGVILILREAGAAVKFESELVPGLWIVKTIQKPASEVMKNLAGKPEFAYVVANQRRSISVWGKALGGTPAVADPKLPNFPPQPTTWVKDPREASNYGTGQNLTRKVWQKFGVLGSAKTVIAVIDTGVDYTHPDLMANMWRNPGEVGRDANGASKEANGIDDDGNGYVDDVVGYDFANNDSLPFDDNLHGTHVAGIAAGVGGNGIGIAGHCPRCSIMAVKFISADGWGSDTGAAQAVEYAAKMGATVANSSWGGEGWSQPLYDIFKATADMGLLHVVAAGNDGKDLRTYHQVPAIFHVPGQLTVSALYEANIYMPFWSNYGSDDSDLSCAGADVYSTVPGKSYRPLSGTSMASPGIAGDVALIKSHRPGISYQEIHRLLDKYSISDKDSMRKVRFQGRPNMLKVFGDL